MLHQRRKFLLQACAATAASLFGPVRADLVEKSKPAAKPEPYSKGLLWRVSKPGKPASHVFGTIHIPDPRVLMIPDPVQAAFDASGTYAMEIQLAVQEEARFFEAAQFEDGRRLEPLIGARAYAELARQLHERKVPDEVIARLKPWAALANLTVTPVDYANQTLDQKLFAAARARHMVLHPLEGVEEQIAVFESIPLESQVALLQHALANRDWFVSRLEPAIQAWLKRDLAALWRINQETGRRFPEVASHYAVLMERVVINRSVVMAHRLFTPLREGRAFVAVGALHLYGRLGVLALIAKQGYRVARVY